jgi:hypothetical protein
MFVIFPGEAYSTLDVEHKETTSMAALQKAGKDPSAPKAPPSGSVAPEQTNFLQSAISIILHILWNLVRIPIFLTLFWLRGPIILLCECISGTLFLAFIILLVVSPDRTGWLWALGGASFGVFVLAWAYDYLLMILSPHTMIRILD